MYRAVCIGFHLNRRVVFLLPHYGILYPVEYVRSSLIKLKSCAGSRVTGDCSTTFTMRMPGASVRITLRRARAAMALAALSGDAQCIIFSQLCNVLDPRVAVDFGSITNELWAATQALRQQLRADREAATALCLKMGMRSC